MDAWNGCSRMLHPFQNASRHVSSKNFRRPSRSSSSKNARYAHGLERIGLLKDDRTAVPRVATDR